MTLKMHSVWGVVLAALFSCHSVTHADDSLVGHWKLTTNAQDSTAAQNHATAHHLKFIKDSNGKPAATFDGRSSYLELPDSSVLNTKTGNFTYSLWVNASEKTDDVVGDLLSKYDASTRQGFNLSLKTNAGVTSCQSNYRHLQFGIDAGKIESDWTDHGQVGNAIFIFSMATHNGELYTGTCERGANGAGHVQKWAGDDKWIDCGAPDDCNAITSLAVFEGKLYAGTGKYRLAGSALKESANLNKGGKVFRYEGGKRWTFCGQLPEVEAINGMVIYNGKLFASSLYKPGGLFSYDGGTKWTSHGLPDGKRVESLTVYNGFIFATGYDEGAIYKYDGANWSKVGQFPGSTQTYGFTVYEGQLYASEWPNALVYRYEKDNEWVSVGKLGNEKESMPLVVYNGKMYCGSLPLAAVFRYDGGETWTDLGRLDKTPDVKYRRAWSMTVHQGRLFSGTIPAGRVYSIEAGRNATYGHTFPAGWHHVVAQRAENHLNLYLDGKLVAQSSEFNKADYDLTNSVPVKIGKGAHDYFHGQMRHVRLYNRALTASEINELYQAKN